MVDYTPRVWTEREVLTSEGVTRIENGVGDVADAISPTALGSSPYFLREVEQYRVSRADVAGLSDVKAVVLACVTAAQADGIRRVSLPPGTLDLATQLTLPTTTAVEIVGHGQDTIIRQTAAAAAYAKALIASIGTDATPVALAGDLAAGSRSLTLPSGVASALSVGDCVGFMSEKPVFDVGGALESKAAEHHRVESVSGTTVIIDNVLIFDYLVSDTAQAYKVNLAPPVRLRDMVFTSDDATTHAYRAIWLEKNRDFLIENVSFNDAGGGIHVADSYGGEINSVVVNRLRNYSSYLGYGVTLLGRTAEVAVNNLRGRSMRHLFTTLDNGGYGGPRDITIRDGIGHSGESGYSIWDTHPEGYNITFDNCRAYGGSSSTANGFQIRSIKTRLINCSAIGTGQCGVTVTSSASDCDIVGGEYSRNVAQGVKINAPNVRVRNVRADLNAAAGISWSSAATDLLIEGNKVTKNQYGIQGANVDDGDVGVIIRDNILPKDGVAPQQNISFLNISKPAIVTRNICMGHGVGDDGSNGDQTGLVKIGNITDSGYLTGSGTWDPGSIATGASTSTTFTVTGATLNIGHVVEAVAGISLGGLTCNAYVSASNTVTVVLANLTAGAVDLASSTWRITVRKDIGT